MESDTGLYSLHILPGLSHVPQVLNEIKTLGVPSISWTCTEIQLARWPEDLGQ